MTAACISTTFANRVRVLAAVDRYTTTTIIVANEIIARPADFRHRLSVIEIPVE